MSESKTKWGLILTVIILLVVSVATFIMQGNDGQLPVEQNVHKHEVKGESCYLCDSSKREKGRLWCKEHNRYENRCWICQPQLRDEKRQYCKEHLLYEDECMYCNSDFKKKK
ncbi:MAG: hypothetical protein KC471_01465 [Flavobacteriaceae bacterium]|nr:hypothetical protein [Flavobacteriaceae bacterium]